MNRYLTAASFLSVAAILIMPATATAQKNEIGAQFSGMHLHKIDEAPLCIGARYGYVVTPFLTADAELSHCPENSSGNFGETFTLAGGRIGKRFEKIGVYAKLRGGFIHFGGDYFVLRLNRRTHSMLDAGGVLEYYPNLRVILRIDLSDAVIYYGNARLFNRPDPDALGTVHNFMPGFGIAVRF